ncbi:MAG: tyrosine-type recombinase/integrase [Clostridia bacterium]|nr:tyrosine-type recombinase/integrase [Clostridia bacterium]
MEIANINEFVNDFVFALKDNYSEGNIRNTLFMKLYETQKGCTDLVIRDEKENIVRKFCICKRIEGCSEKTIKLYLSNLGMFYKFIQKDFIQVTTDDIRYFLATQMTRGVCENTCLNRKRTLSTFYNFLVQEGIVSKNPVDPIKTIKTKKQIKESVEDLDLEKIRDFPMSTRNRAVFELLLSTGMRISEMCNLNKEDLDFQNSQCIVLGKGNKERICFLNARSIYWLQKYLKERKDDNKALFVSELAPYKRLEVAGAEIFLRKIGQKIGVRLHPHKLRRTVATQALSKGMPIEQIQTMLGHNSISTTTEYAITKVKEVKHNHNRLLQ